MKIDWVRKLTSRKFWMAIAAFTGMLVSAFGVAESEVTQITSLILAGATVIAYIIGEGLTDSANGVVEIETDVIAEAAEEVKDTKESK